MNKPILKWIGGKTQILKDILDKFPKDMDNYHEIFLGGASILIGLLHYRKEGLINIKERIFAYDINEPLIYFYKNIQENHLILYNNLIKIIDEYKKEEDKESYYYYQRDVYNSLENKKSIEASSLFLFLNKTCFRGMYRESKNGFNVPYGNYKNPEIINKNHLEEIHNLIKDVIFIHKDFKLSLNSSFNSNDFIYLDPPYYPEKNNSFVNYNKDGFNLKNHNDLFEIIKKFNCKFLMNNADVKYVNDYFNDYIIQIILCKRKINSKNPQSITNEIIITNY
jgi:DNA adenine methylase